MWNICIHEDKTPMYIVFAYLSVVYFTYVISVLLIFLVMTQFYFLGLNNTPLCLCECESSRLNSGPYACLANICQLNYLLSPSSPCFGLVSVCFYFFVVVIVVVETRSVLMCSSGCPGTCYVDQVGFELTEIHLLLPPACFKGMHL